MEDEDYRNQEEKKNHLIWGFDIGSLVKEKGDGLQVVTGGSNRQGCKSLMIPRVDMREGRRNRSQGGILASKSSITKHLEITATSAIRLIPRPRRGSGAEAAAEEEEEAGALAT